MKSKDVKCNKHYWSKRHNCKCTAVSVARWMVELKFLDSSNDGWYHCQELREITSEDEKVIDISSLLR